MATRQSDRWDQVADSRHKWAAVFEEGLRPVTDRLLEMAGVGPGQRVLDVGTGTGEPALSAAVRVGPGGRVVGVDTSAAMIELAAARARGRGLTNAEFMVGDAECLDPGQSPFDSVLCRFVLMFLPDLSGALHRIRAVMADGGRFAAAVLGPLEKTPMISIMARASNPKGKAVAGAGPGQPDLFRLACPEALESALTRAGFTDVKAEILVSRQSFSTVEDFIAFQADTNPDFTKHLAELGAEGRRDVFERITLAAGPYISPEGALDLDGESTLAVGTR